MCQFFKLPYRVPNAVPHTHPVYDELVWAVQQHTCCLPYMSGSQAHGGADQRGGKGRKRGSNEGFLKDGPPFQEVGKDYKQEALLKGTLPPSLFPSLPEKSTSFELSFWPQPGSLKSLQQSPSRGTYHQGAGKHIFSAAKRLQWERVNRHWRPREPNYSREETSDSDT